MSDFFERLRAAVGKNPPSGVQLAPNLEPKRMANAAKWAPFGQEQPLLLVDNTLFGSGKAGVLVTSHALYFDDPKTRIDLAEVVHPPVFPEGVTNQGRLRTARGEVLLPVILGDDESEIVRQVLLAVVSINRGTTSGVIPSLEGPIGALAAQFLEHKDVNLAPNLPREKLRSAAATFTDWLDHASGERALAFLDETALGKGDEGVLLTDRRLLAYTEASAKHVMIPYGAMTNVTASKGFLEKKLQISAEHFSGEVPLITCADAIEPLALFLRGLLQLPPDQRWTPPIAYGSAHDPSGAFGLLETLGAPDVRIPLMLRYVGELSRQGAMPPAMGADLVARIHMLHRTLTFGRGMARGFRQSPLHGADFHFMLSTVFGEPIRVTSNPVPPDPYQGTPAQVHHSLDFALGSRSNVAGAAASTAVGLALLAVVGVGWVSTPKRNLESVRVVITDLPSSTGFAALGVLGGRIAPLAEVDPKVLGFLLGALDDLEALITFYRAVFGWELAPNQLFQYGAELRARVAHVLGPTDLSTFDARTA